jgi:hypothetical protein
MNDHRGFVLCGIALLLVLPAMLLVATLANTTTTESESASLRVLSDKAYYLGRDIEHVIKAMENDLMPINDFTMNQLADNYRRTTGLIVNIKVMKEYPLWIHVLDTGVKHYAGTKYCRITDVSPGVWRYNFEDLDEEIGQTVDFDYNEPRLLVEKLYGSIRLTVEEYQGGYHASVHYSDLEPPIFPRIGNFVDNVGQTAVVENMATEVGVLISIGDPGNTVKYVKTVPLGR